MLRLTTAWTFAGVLLYLATPLVAPALLPLAAVAPLGWYWARTQRFPDNEPSPTIVALALATLYLAVNATWSLSPRDAYFSIAWLAVLIATLHVTLPALRDTEQPVLRAITIGLYAAMAAGGAIICLEVLSQQWLRRLLIVFAPGLRPDPDHMVVQNGQIIHLGLHLMNRSIAVLMLLLWPTVLIAVRLAATPRQCAWLLAGLLPVVVAIMRAQHGTSKIAFFGAGAIFALFLLAPTVARRLTLAAWIAATLLVAPMAKLAYSGQLHLADWLPPSAQHRVIIWGATVEKIAEAPLLGAGISTARALHNRAPTAAPWSPETARTTALHSHNAYLQTWYETGAIGALLLLGFGLLVLRALAAAPPACQPYLYATFAACALMGASSFSLWQAWFMASFGLAAIAAGLASALRRPDAARGAG